LEIGSDEQSDDGPSTAAEQGAARLLGDEAALYRALSRQLVRTIQFRVVWRWMVVGHERETAGMHACGGGQYEAHCIPDCRAIS
jgi:hypothetical protein